MFGMETIFNIFRLLYYSCWTTLDLMSKIGSNLCCSKTNGNNLSFSLNHSLKVASHPFYIAYLDIIVFNWLILFRFFKLKAKISDKMKPNDSGSNYGSTVRAESEGRTEIPKQTFSISEPTYNEVHLNGSRHVSGKHISTYSYFRTIYL